MHIFNAYKLSQDLQEHQETLATVLTDMSLTCKSPLPPAPLCSKNMSSTLLTRC